MTLREKFNVSQYVRYQLGLTSLGIWLPKEYLEKPCVKKYIKEYLKELQVYGIISNYREFEAGQ